MEREKILEIVIENVKNLIDTFPDDKKFEVAENTVLFGSGASIDSLSLVTVIVDLESVFSQETNTEFSLTDDRAMTRKISPFDSISSLTDYIYEITN